MRQRNRFFEERNGAGAVREESPDGDQRAPAVPEISGLPGRSLRSKTAEIPLEDGELLAAGGVVHQSPDPAVLPGRTAHVRHDRVAVLPAARCADLLQETLEKYAGDAVFPHPAEVTVDRRGIPRAEDEGGRTVRFPERRFVPLLRRCFAHIRPAVDAGGVRVEPAVRAAVMPPAAPGTVAGRVEPPLITAEQQPFRSVVRDRLRRPGLERGAQQEQGEQQPFHFSAPGSLCPEPRSFRCNTRRPPGPRIPSAAGNPRCRPGKSA